MNKYGLKRLIEMPNMGQVPFFHHLDCRASIEINTTQFNSMQAYLTLGPDGAFQIENVGRQQLFVDGAGVAQFSGASLRHLSLVEVGGVRLMFMINAAAMERILKRSARLAI